MKPSPSLYIFISVLLAIVCATHIVTKCQQSRLEPTTSQETVEIIRDTIPVFVEVPVARDSVVVRYVNVTVPAVSTTPADSSVTDSIQITLPITQKIYTDSTYEAWVSGYMPSLDSIRIFHPRAYITRTVTNTQVRYETKRWGLGVQVGAGVTPGKIEPYVGIGISYNIFSW